MNNQSSEIDFIEEYENRAEEASKRISAILNKFILEEKDLLKLDESKKKIYSLADILQDNTLIITYYCFISAFILSFPILFNLEVAIGVIRAWIYFAFLLTLAFTIYICCKYSNAMFVSFKEIRTKAIPRAASYYLKHYYQIIEQLGETFQEDYLNREEVRFKLVINKTKKGSNLIKKASLLISIFIVVIAVLIFGSPDKHTEVKYLYGTVVGLSGVAFVVKVFLDILFELSDRQEIDVYEKCVLILQQAQHIAREEERDAIQAYDEATSFDDEVVPFERVISETELNHQ